MVETNATGKLVRSFKDIAEDVIASVDNTFNLGSASKRWATLFVVIAMLSSIVIGGTVKLTTSGNILLINDSTQIQGNLTVDRNLLVKGNLTVLGNETILNVTTLSINGSLNPALDDTFDLGTTSLRWKNLFLSGNVTADFFKGNGSELTDIIPTLQEVYDKDDTLTTLNKDVTHTIENSGFSNSRFIINLNDRGEVGWDTFFIISTTIDIIKISTGTLGDVVQSVTWIPVFDNTYGLGSGSTAWRNLFVGSNLTVDTNTFFVNSNSNRVGINTTTPQNTLNVLGDLNVTTNFTVDVNTLFINSNSNKVGINTTSPNALLDVRGDVIFNEDSEDKDFRVEGSGEENLLFTDAGNDRFGVGTDTPVTDMELISHEPAGGLQFTGSNVFSPGFTFADGDSVVRRAVLGLANLAGHFSVDAAVGDFIIRVRGRDIIFATTHSSYPVIMMIDHSGQRVGIKTMTPSYPLEVNANVSDISIWAQTNISATGFITRTSAFDKSKNVWDYVKDASYYLINGEIDHSKFYGYAGEYDVTDYSRPIKEFIVVPIFNKTTQEIQNITQLKITYPFMKTESGVSLNAEVDLLRQGVFQLKQENDLMKQSLCKLGEIQWC